EPREPGEGSDDGHEPPTEPGRERERRPQGDGGMEEHQVPRRVLGGDQERAVPDCRPYGEKADGEATLAGTPGSPAADRRQRKPRQRRDAEDTQVGAEWRGPTHVLPPVVGGAAEERTLPVAEDADGPGRHA